MRNRAGRPQHTRPLGAGSDDIVALRGRYRAVRTARRKLLDGMVRGYDARFCDTFDRHELHIVVCRCRRHVGGDVRRMYRTLAHNGHTGRSQHAIWNIRTCDRRIIGYVSGSVQRLHSIRNRILGRIYHHSISRTAADAISCRRQMPQRCCEGIAQRETCPNAKARAMLRGLFHLIRPSLFLVE